MYRISIAFALAATVVLSLLAGRPVVAQSPPATKPDSLAAERDRLVREVLKEIAGRETAPAESVFKDIRIFEGMPAGRVVRIMDVGFGKSLGVGCDHCHTTGEWEKEDKHEKQIARDMWAMVGTINRDLLPKIEHLESERPTVNCTTCHRGQVKPALNLDGH